MHNKLGVSMMRGSLRFLRLPLALIVVMFPLRSLGQITFQTVPAPVQSLSINDIDFINSTTPKWIFSVIMTSSSPTPVDGVTMEMKLSAYLSTGEQFEDLVFLSTDQFTVTGSRTITNLDLKDENLRGEYIVDENGKTKLEDIALSSGVVPAGKYRFAVQVFVDGVPQQGDGDFSLLLTNPSGVELLSPSDGDNYVSQYPLFQWQGDATSWRISIFQKLPGQGSLEESASGIPHLMSNTDGLSFQYPGSGARLLETGNTYVWFVEGLRGVAGGTTQTIKSPLRSFQVSSATGSGNTISALLDELERVLGSRYQGVIDEMRQQELTSSGIIRLNGSPITAAELTSILNALRSSPETVSSVVLE
ncbi:MAG: hypothetical protein ACKVRP_06660 [Bacteroidota bacterium]